MTTAEIIILYTIQFKLIIKKFKRDTNGINEINLKFEVESKKKRNIQVDP